MDTIRQWVGALPAVSSAPIVATLLADAGRDTNALPDLAIILLAGTLTAGTTTAVRPALLAGAVGRTASTTGADLAEITAETIALLVGAEALPVDARGRNVTLAAGALATVGATLFVDAIGHADASAFDALPVGVLRAGSTVGLGGKYTSDVGIAGICSAGVAVIAIDDCSLAT